MKIQHSLVRIWQKAPISWRTGLVSSRFAPFVRRLANSLSDDTDVFLLAAPLEGWRMRLEWHSSKAFVFGTYEREVASALQQMVQPGWTVLDIGAHVGYFTLLLAKLVGPSGCVVAFEPFPSNFRTLQENVRMNGCANIVLANKAVGATSGMVTLRTNDENNLTYTASLLHGRPVMDIECVKLDDYVSVGQKRIQFVLMDVEGAEAAVLEGMKDILQRDRPTFIIEIHGFDGLGELHPALQAVKAMNYSFRYLEKPSCEVHILAEPRKRP